MKYNYILYSVILSTLFFFNHSSNADPVVLKLLDGVTWNGEVGQTVSVKYNDKVQDKEIVYTGELTRVANSYIVVEDEFLFIDQIITIQTIENGDQQVLPNAEQSKEISKNVSKDDVDTAEFRWVVVRGAGLTSDEAKQDAWRNAIERVAGVFITANSQIENGQLVKDHITAHSNAYIEEFKLIDEDIKPDIVRVRIKAKVALKMLLEKLQSAGGELEFRSVDGESKYAKIVTKNQQTKSAIETLPAAMEGYPEALIDIEIGETRMAMESVFNDGKEHLIVPITFSWNNKAWTTFSNNLNEYLKHVSEDTNSFRLRPEGLFFCEPRTRHQYSYSAVAVNWVDEKSWMQQGWERASIRGVDPIFGRFRIDPSLRDMYNIRILNKQVQAALEHDYIYDTVIVLGRGFKRANSYSVSRDIWDSILERFKQVPAFFLAASSKVEGEELGQPFDRGEFPYSTYYTFARKDFVTSLPEATGLRRSIGEWNQPDFVGAIDEEDIDRSSKAKSPRVMFICPYFMMDFWGLNDESNFYCPQYTYDYIIELDLDEVDNVDGVEIERYVLDLHNKGRRDNESLDMGRFDSPGDSGGPIGGPPIGGPPIGGPAPPTVGGRR